MFEQPQMPRRSVRTETPFLRFWRALADSCSATGADAPTMGGAKRAWAAQVADAVAA